MNIAFGFVAYLSYGDCHGDTSSKTCTQQNIVDNLPDTASTATIRVLLSLQLTFTAVVFLFPMSETLEAELFDKASFGQLRVRFLHICGG